MLVVKAGCDTKTKAKKPKSQKAIYRAGRRLGISWALGPGTVAGRGVEVVVVGGLLVVVGFGVGALGAMAGRVGDLDKAPAVEHKARPSAVGGEPPGPVDLTEEEVCHHPLLLVGVEAAVLGGELLCHRFGDDVDVVGRLPEGAYDQPQDPALVPVVVELGVEAVARVPAKASVKLLGPVVVVLVDRLLKAITKDRTSIGVDLGRL